MLYVGLITCLLVLITIVVAVNMFLNFTFYLTCIGQIFLLIMVYKVLKCDYSTTQTFDDFYEHHPIIDYRDYR
jgi:hypothetical protein